MKRFLAVIVVVLAAGSVCFGAAKAEPGVSLTVYNDGTGVVRENRVMGFDKGVNTMRFVDVASQIDPTSVRFECLSSPGAISILEQNYEYDLVNTDSLLRRYIDKKVMVSLKGSGASERQYVQGVLLSAMGGDLIVKNNEGNIEIINRGTVNDISLTELPEDLVTRPTLVWLANSEKAGEELCQVSYMTGGIRWKADYTAVLNADDTALDMSGWVTITNNCGATYKDAGLKLIAGDVRRIQPAAPMVREKLYMARAAAPLAEEGFEEKAFMEYHMYTLGRKSTIKNNQVKQIEFIEPATGVKANKIYVYERNSRWYRPGQQGQSKVNVKIELENKKENGLGIPLPKGKVRVFKKDPADDSLEFVGEDEIDHTPKNEKLSLYIGDAFDIVAEHTMVSYKEQYGRRIESHKVEIRNRKDEPVTVFVDERMPRYEDWRVESSNIKYEKKDAFTVRFPVKVGADSTATLEYTMSWPLP